MSKGKFIFLSVLLVIGLTGYAQPARVFNSLQEILEYAHEHSTSFQNFTQQDILARYQTVAAKLSMFNLKGDAVISSVKNTMLPVSFLPAKIFGGPEGAYQRVTLGQKFNNAATINPQIDILSPYNAAKVKLSRANENVTTLNNLIGKRDLYQSIAGTYYNILSDQWQIAVTEKTLNNADSIEQIFKNRQNEGLTRPQDVNSAIANRLSIEDKLQQLQTDLEQQYNSLKIFCDMDAEMPIEILDQKNSANFDDALEAADNLSSRQANAQREYQNETLHADKKWFYPTLTAYGSYSFQQYSNVALYSTQRWYPINYVGLKLTVPLLPDANKIAAVRYDRVNLRIAEINAKHSAIQDSMNNRQSELDYRKAFKSYAFAKQITSLKEDIYKKNLNIYEEGILSATDLFNSFNDWLNSSLTEQIQLANSEYAKAKILIARSIR